MGPFRTNRSHGRSAIMVNRGIRFVLNVPLRNLQPNMADFEPIMLTARIEGLNTD